MPREAPSSELPPWLGRSKSYQGYRLLLQAVVGLLLVLVCKNIFKSALECH